jgi:ketosteroid isomerase-like protein
LSAEIVKELQTMKQLIQLSIVLLAMTGTSWTAEPSSSVKEAVLNAESAWKDAVLKGDRNALDKLLSADLSYTHSSAKTQTKEQFIQDVMSGATSYKSIDLENTKLRQYGEVVVVTHSAVITTTQTGTSHLYLTEVWAHEGGRWQMVSRQATRLP